MHMAAVVEMTVINIEFADELVLVSVGNAGCRNMLAFQNGRGGGGHRWARIRAKIAGDLTPT